MFDSSKASLDQLITELDRIGLAIKIEPRFLFPVHNHRRVAGASIALAYTCELFYKWLGDVVFESPVAKPTIIETVRFAVNYVMTGKSVNGDLVQDEEVDSWEDMILTCANYRVDLGHKTSRDSWMREICDEAIMSLQDVRDIGENMNLDLMWAQDADPIDVGREIASMMNTPDPQDQTDEQIDWSRAFC